MIAFLDDHPLVQLEDGQTIVFEQRWLEIALQRAARAAGYSNWWLAGDVVESVSQYLQADFEETILPTARLEATVRAVLQSIGYADIAMHFESMPPPVRISLLRMAHLAGEGFELLFFELLKRELAGALAAGAVQVELHGLGAAVKFLRRAKNWRRDCSILRSEVVEFIRRESTRCLGDCRAGDFHLEIQ